MELVVVELDTNVELDATEYAEVVGTEVIGGTDLGNGCGTAGVWSQRGRDGRRESGFGRQASSAESVPRE